MPGFNPSDKPAIKTAAWPHRQRGVPTTFGVRTTLAPVVRQETVSSIAGFLGDQTCGYIGALQSTVTCSNAKGQLGYCTNVGDYRGCCWGPSDGCSVMMPTTCIGSTALGSLGGSNAACPQGAKCCTRDDNPACVVYNYVTGTDVFTYFGCGSVEMIDNMTPIAAAPALGSSTLITTADAATISGQVTASTMLSSPTQDSQLSHKSSSTGKIVGGVIGGAAVLCTILAVILFIFCRHHRRKAQPLVISRPIELLKPAPEEDEIQQTSSTEDPSPQSAGPSPTTIPSPEMGRARYKSFRRSYGPAWPLGHGDPLESHPPDLEKRLSKYDNRVADSVPQIQLPTVPQSPLSHSHSPSKHSRKSSVAARSPQTPASATVGLRSPSTLRGFVSTSPVTETPHPDAIKQAGSQGAPSGGSPTNRIESPRPVSPLEEDEAEQDNNRISLISMPSMPRQSVLPDDLVSPISPDPSTRDERRSFATVSPVESRRSSMTETGLETGIEGRRVTLGQIKEINLDGGHS